MVAYEALKVLQQNGLAPPGVFTMAITGTCNLSCSHCWVKADGNAVDTHVPERILCRLLEEFMELGGGGVRFTGGEPLGHPAWLKLLQFSRSIGLLDISIQTNGLLFTEENIASLRELEIPQLMIQISLDGATPETHDLVRGEGAFYGVMAGLKRLVQGGLAGQVAIFFTEMRHNLSEIPDVLELAADLGVGSVATGSLVICGRAENNSLVMPPETDQYLQLLHRYDADTKFRDLYERLGNIAALEWCKECDPRADCCTFIENPYLTASGRLYPCVLCHADEYSVTGVFGKNLATAFTEGAPLWRSLLQISRSRSGLLAQCQECPGQMLCAGGCMGRSWGSYRDFLAADDRCHLRRTIYRKN